MKHLTLWKNTLVKTLHCENYHTAKILHCYKYCNVKILGCQDITLWKLLQCKNLTPSSYHSVKILHCCNRDDTVRTEIMLWKDMPQTRQHVLKARWRISVPRSWYQDLGTKILVPRSWHQDLGTYHFEGKGKTHKRPSGQGFRTAWLITSQKFL